MILIMYNAGCIIAPSLWYKPWQLMPYRVTCQGRRKLGQCHGCPHGADLIRYEGCDVITGNKMVWQLNHRNHMPHLILVIFLIDIITLLELCYQNRYYAKQHQHLCCKVQPTFAVQGLALLTLSWDKNWDSHSLVNGYPIFYPRIALVAPSPGLQYSMKQDLYHAY